MRMPTAILTLRFKGGAGSGHRGHAGRPGKRGGSLPGAGGAVVPEAPTPKPSEADIKKFLSVKGPLVMYHVTPTDYLVSIAEKGLIPGAKEAPGQDWKADHSDYATYFFGHPIGAQTSMDAFVEDGINEFAIVKTMITRTREVALRVLPDEDVSLNKDHGLRAINKGESVAMIGGIKADNISGFVICGDWDGGEGDETIWTLMDMGFDVEMYEDDDWTKPRE